jgi:GNAT superfamily N-acetyltransferase
MPKRDDAEHIHPPGGTLRLLASEDVDEAATLLAKAFAEEPAKVAILPGESQRFRFLRLMALGRVRTTVPYAAAYGIEIDRALAGVALWNPPGVQPSALRFAGIALRALIGDRRRAFPTVALMARRLWRDRGAARRIVTGRREAVRVAARGRSWYLALLGTHPDFRGRGVARRLLEHVLHRCDEDGVPVWTETTDGANVAMYERFRFATVTRVRGGGIMPDLWVLRREPSLPGSR